MQKKLYEWNQKEMHGQDKPGQKRFTDMELCKKSANILKEHLYWTPGNEKEIKIWKYNCGNASLANFL